jgi:hypothetical protein
MVGRKSLLAGVVAVAAAVGGGGAYAATHASSAQHARRPLVKLRFHPPRAEPKNHFCHPGKRGSEFDSLQE